LQLCSGSELADVLGSYYSTECLRDWRRIYWYWYGFVRDDYWYWYCGRRFFICGFFILGHGRCSHECGYVGLRMCGDWSCWHGLVRLVIDSTSEMWESRK
jgi:hypothetical protein